MELKRPKSSSQWSTEKQTIFVASLERERKEPEDAFSSLATASDNKNYNLHSRSLSLFSTLCSCASTISNFAIVDANRRQLVTQGSRLMVS